MKSLPAIAGSGPSTKNPRPPFFVVGFSFAGVRRRFGGRTPGVAPQLYKTGDKWPGWSWIRCLPISARGRAERPALVVLGLCFGGYLLQLTQY